MPATYRISNPATVGAEVFAVVPKDLEADFLFIFWFCQRSAIRKSFRSYIVLCRVHRKTPTDEQRYGYQEKWSLEACFLILVCMQHCVNICDAAVELFSPFATASTQFQDCHRRRLVAFVSQLCNVHERNPSCYIGFQMLLLQTDLF